MNAASIKWSEPTAEENAAPGMSGRVYVGHAPDGIRYDVVTEAVLDGPHAYRVTRKNAKPGRWKSSAHTHIKSGLKSLEDARRAGDADWAKLS